MFKNFLSLSLFVVILISLNSAISQNSDYLSLKSFSDKESYSKTDTVKIALKISIRDHYHINSYEVNDPTLIQTSISVDSKEFKMLNSFFPEHKKLKFEFTENEINVYEGEIYAGINLIISSPLDNGIYEVPVNFSYQACDDKVCYPPKTINELISVKIDNENPSGKVLNTEIFSNIDFQSPVSIKEKSGSSETGLKENTRTDTPDSENADLAAYVEEHGIAALLFFIFLGGLALNLTPCVYPLIPITVSYFGAQANNSKSQSIMMGVFYALGMSITYSALGVFAALTGSLLGTALQNPIVIIGIALILIALGTSMFGLFEIRVPQSLAMMGNKNRSGYFGSLLMGLTVGFIAAPCIGPFVLSLLVYVGKLGSAFSGFLLFFVLSLGLGLPYIFLAASSSSISKLPRSGEWMEGVKIIFGLILFGMALNTLEPLIPKSIFHYLFPVYIVFSGLYLLLIDKKGKTSKIYTNIKNIIAIIAIVMGAWMLKPEGEVEEVKWTNLNSLQSIEQSIQAGNKPVMIDFYADWCAQCKELDKYTYTNPEVVELSNSFNNIKVDLTKENSSITDKFDIKGLPVVVFLNSNGEEVKELRVTGFLKPEEFKKKLNSIK
ncbi:MAG TPA: protein-disulfide reductase DsbD [Ignavibacteria bacterium]|nr:protein-disulfide reductase DsbD [Ignavibacteria bacterium]